MRPVLFQLGEYRLFSYGCLIALGGVVTAFFWDRKRAKMGLSRDEDFWLLINVILFGGFIGGRLMYLFEYVPPRQWWDALLVFNRGFSVLGAFGGVVGGVWLFCRRRKLEFLRVLDYVAVAAPLWHAFGRLGCFLAGCCYGRPTGLPWAVTFHDHRAMVAPALKGLPLHPTQLYEAGADLILFGLLTRFVLRRAEEGRLGTGAAAGAYFVSYGALRFVLEFFRGDVVRPAGWPVTAGQGLSIALAAAGAALLCTRYSSGSARSS